MFTTKPAWAEVLNKTSPAKVEEPIVPRFGDPDELFEKSRAARALNGQRAASDAANKPQKRIEPEHEKFWNAVKPGTCTWSHKERVAFAKLLEKKLQEAITKKSRYVFIDDTMVRGGVIVTFRTLKDPGEYNAVTKYISPWTWSPSLQAYYANRPHPPKMHTYFPEGSLVREILQTIWCAIDNAPEEARKKYSVIFPVSDHQKNGHGDDTFPSEGKIAILITYKGDEKNELDHV